MDRLSSGYHRVCGGGEDWPLRTNQLKNAAAGSDFIPSAQECQPFAFGRTEDTGNGKNMCRPSPRD